MRARVLTPLLFLSGTAALVLEVSWFRRMAQVAGGTSVALAAVLAAVIGGMAAGSLLFGRVADRFPRPLRLYGFLELGIGAAAFLSPWLLDASVELFVLLERNLDSGFALPAARFLLAALLLALPALLMGGTLPAAAAALRPPPALRGRGIGWLYASNTLGAVAGTLAAGFLLLPALGLAGTMRVAAGIGAAAGIAALLLPGSTVPPARSPAAGGGGAGRAIALYAASGFLGLLAEVAFTRSLVLVFGSTTYSFSVMLAVFLFGIGAGSLLGARVRKNHLRRLELTVAVTAAVFSLSALAVYALPRLYLVAVAAWGQGFGAGLAIRFLLAALVLLPGALGLGLAFPLAVHVAAARGAGAGTGRLYAANTAASVAGSTLGVFLLVPALGPQGAIAATAAAVAFGVALLARRPLVWGAAALALVGFVPPSGPARERLVTGVFFNPGHYLLGDEIDEVAWEEGRDVPFVAHGRESTVAILRWYGRDSLLIDGKAVASNQILEDLHHLSLLGHLPIAVHREPRSVLVVGLGMGITYRAAAQHDLEVLRVVELEEQVVHAARRAGITGEDIVIGDARTYLRATGDRFDVITSDPIHPWVRGGGDLYTREYFESCRARLGPGGVACQWLPVYQTGVENLRAIVRTFCSVFRAAAYYGGGDLVLIGMDGRDPPLPRPIDVPALLEEDLGRLRVADHAALVGAAGDGPLLTDDSLRLEFSAPHHVDNHELAASFAWLRELWGDVPPPYGAVLAAQEAWWRGDGREVDRWMKEALRQAPTSSFVATMIGEKDLVLAGDAIRQGELELAAGDLERAAHRLRNDPRVLGTRADLEAARGNREEAIRLYRELVERFGPSEFLERKMEALK